MPLLICINNGLLNGKKKKLRLGELIDDEDKNTMSAKSCHL